MTGLGILDDRLYRLTLRVEKIEKLVSSIDEKLTKQEEQLKAMEKTVSAIDKRPTLDPRLNVIGPPIRTPYNPYNDFCPICGACPPCEADCR